MNDVMSSVLCIWAQLRALLPALEDRIGYKSQNRALDSGQHSHSVGKCHHLSRPPFLSVKWDKRCPLLGSCAGSIA